MKHPLTHNHYRALPDSLYEEGAPEHAPAPEMLELNQELLADYGLNRDWFETDLALETLAGREHADGNTPVAMAYAGHQFGHWVPLLGDGRAHMLGQLTTQAGAIDVQLKGSGRTRFSRGGDGRATLGAVLREYVISEAMAGLSIPTTRSLAVIGTGAHVMREQPQPGALLVRTAASHLRVGTFQLAMTQGEHSVRSLADFCLTHYYPQCQEQPNPYGAMLSEIITRQAHLIARWMLTGFIHGVMNTDNMSIVGETIDYGPCAFMDEFHPRKVFSSIDRMGRYAWNQQASIGLWNLTQLAHTLAPLLANEEHPAGGDIDTHLEPFARVFEAAFHQGFAAKIGVSTDCDVSDMIQSTFDLLTEHAVDFTQFFDALTLMATTADEEPFQALFESADVSLTWLDRWHAVRASHPADTDTMRQANPRLIARNHRVEQAIQAAEERDDLAPFRTLCRALSNPYELPEADAHLAKPPRAEERVLRTYCGT